MVVTHLFQILAFMAMEPPTALAPKPISEEKNKVFRSMLPIQPADVVRGQYIGYRAEEGVDPESDTETFIALKCSIDNWRWAGVPFYLRTGKRLAEGQRIISIAFREPPKSMFPADSGVGAHGPDHLTFDLADASKMSLSFYGKRPGPGMRLDKLSLQFAMHDTGLIGDVLEAYERLILDAMRGDHTLFTTAEGIERLVGGVGAAARSAAAGAFLRAGLVGAERDPPADRAARLATAVRARLARPEPAGCLKRRPMQALFALASGAPVAAVLLLVIVVASLIGLYAAPAMLDRNLLRPYWLLPKRQYATLVTSGFLHADVPHLFFNGFTFWAFGFWPGTGDRQFEFFGALHVRAAGQRRGHLVQAPPQPGLSEPGCIRGDSGGAVRVDRLLSGCVAVHISAARATARTALCTGLPGLFVLRRAPGAGTHQP